MGIRTLSKNMLEIKRIMRYSQDWMKKQQEYQALILIVNINNIKLLVDLNANIISNIVDLHTYHHRNYTNFIISRHSKRLSSTITMNIISAIKRKLRDVIIIQLLIVKATFYSKFPLTYIIRSRGAFKIISTSYKLLTVTYIMSRYFRPKERIIMLKNYICGRKTQNYILG